MFSPKKIDPAIQNLVKSRPTILYFAPVKIQKLRFSGVLGVLGVLECSKAPVV
jgi:hypothetical protein